MSETAANYTLDLFTDLPPPARPTRAPGTRRAPALGQDSYFNTTGESGAQLVEYRQKAASQETIVKRFFQRHPGVAFGPSEVFVVLPTAPPTSTRRAITNLTKAGVLIKTDNLQRGVFGKSEYKWKLNPAWRPEE